MLTFHPMATFPTDFDSIPIATIAHNSIRKKMEAAGLRFTRLETENFAVYQVHDCIGEFLFTVGAESVDDPEKWESRSQAEQEAIMDLTMDEYVEVHYPDCNELPGGFCALPEGEGLEPIGP